MNREAVERPEQPAGDVVLAAVNVSKRHAGTLALDQASVEVRRGECVVLIGESGAGKTTLLRCFNRLVEPEGGRVLVEGVDARDLDPIALRRRIGYVPQEGGLLPHWRVGRNVELVPWLNAELDAPARASRALHLVGLDPERFTPRWPRELSGGERQRVAVARALANRPGIVLLDEPFGALDAITRAELQASFRELHAGLAFTAVLVTHDLREAFDLGQRIVVLRRGRVEQAATAAELLTAPATPYVADLLARARVA